MESNKSCKPVHTIDRIGGKVARHYDFWTSITQDRAVLRIVGGVHIPFAGRAPIQASVPKPLKMTSHEKKFVSEKLIELQQLGCI